MPAPLELVGYCPKTTAVPGGLAVPPTVTELCSVSNCLNAPPKGWIDHWLHNELGFFNTQRDARAILPAQASGYALFAYRLMLVRFVKGRREDLAFPQVPMEPLAGSFVSIGFDVVSKSISSFFECSPLSCNGFAAKAPVNRCCLLDSLTDAVALAERCSREEPEPGPYYVIEVLRDESTFP